MRSAAFLCVAFFAACASKQPGDLPALAVAPEEVDMPPGVQQRFSAGKDPVSWSVAEGPAGGSIAADGTYSAPAQSGTFHVLARRGHASASATVHVNVASGVTVAVDPPAADIAPGRTMQLRARVSGAPDRTVFWFVREGEMGGRVDEAGRYRAPLSEGLFHVVAVSQADPSKSAAAAVSVSVKPAITVSIDPPTAALEPQSAARFSAAVTGTGNGAVHWFVAEGTPGGTVDDRGRYVAPQAEGVFHLVAASDADPARSATAEVKVAQSVTVAVTPGVATVRQGSSQIFAAVVSGPDARVSWSIDEGVAGGSVDGRGLYQAPTAPGIFHLTATSAADASRSATAVITVPADTLSVRVDPGLAALRPSQQIQFMASVSGSQEMRVYWTAERGAITQDGVYTAPAEGGTYRVMAQSFADPAKSASAFVTVVPDVVLQLDPPQATVRTGDLIQFHANVAGTQDKLVSWSVQERDGGRIDANGIYAAPKSEGVYHVVAVSHADPGKRAVAAVTVSYFDLIDRGGPVVPETRTFALWWGDPSAWPSDARPTVEALLGGLDRSWYLAVADQYMRGARARTEFAGSLFDNSPAPASGDSKAVAARACAALTRAGFEPEPGDFVVVYGAAPLTAATYCAWHWYASCGRTTLLIAWVPNPSGTTCLSPANPCNSASPIANALATSTAHELLESMTDPYSTTWLDANAREIADKCQDELRCVRIGSANLQIQGAYSNAEHACAVP